MKSSYRKKCLVSICIRRREPSGLFVSRQLQLLSGDLFGVRKIGQGWSMGSLQSLFGAALSTNKRGDSRGVGKGYIYWPPHFLMVYTAPSLNGGHYGSTDL